MKLKKIFLLLVFTAAVFILASQEAYAAMDLTAFTVSPDTDTQVRLDWSSVPGARIYQLLRDDGSGSDTTVASIDVDSVLDSLTYTDTGLQAETGYTYTIKAFSDIGLTSQLDAKTALVATSKIIRPYGVSAVYGINARTVLLTWNSSALATGSIINRTENGVKTPTAVAATTSAIILENGLVPLQFTLQSTAGGSLESLESDSVNITPIEPPIISAASSGGSATISWPAFSQINQFQLERSKWNGISWDSWIIVNSSLSGQSASDTPSAGGKYRYRLAAKSGSGYAGYSSISETTSGLPSPTKLSLTIVNTGRIDLSWTNGAGNEASLQVLRKLTDGSYSTIATLASSTPSYSDAVTVTAGAIYTYRVRSYESAANYSTAAEASISATLPAAPTSLLANAVSTSALALNWTDHSNNESGFRIERMTDTGTFTEIDTAAQNAATYTDTTAFAGITYVYRVRSYNALGNSSYSNEVTIDAWDSIAPATLTVSPVSAARLDLAWSYTGTSSYNTIIERKTGTGGTWTAIHTTAQGTLKYSDTGLSPNTRYFYRVRKSLGTGASGISYPNNEIGTGAYTYLGSLSLSGSAASGNTIYLTWSGNTGGADVIIERKMANGGFSALTTVSSSTTGWYDNTGLVPSASYTYRIKAKNATNESVYSNELTVQNLFIEAPSGLALTVSTNSAIELSWKDNSTDETGFEIWRYIYGSGTYTLYATVDKNMTTYTDTSIQTGVQYSYMVRAYAASGSLYSPYSNSASVGVGLINPPANLYYTYITSSQVLLRWTDTSNNESGFKVEWKIGQDGTWNIFTWLSPNVTAYTVSNLNPYTKYYFRVRSYSSTGNADSLSSEILVSTAIPPAPSGVAVVALSSSQAKISWKDNSDSEEGFRIMRKPANSYYFEPLGEVGKNITTYSDSNLKAGMRYYYKVVSYNATGSSESSESEVRTNTRAAFTDLGSTALWAKDAIENLAGMGITKGASGTLYKPNNTVSKAEFTAMIIRAFKFDTAPVGSLADVKLNKWYYSEIMIAENFGIITGDDKNKFYPEAAITREEIAVILFKALEASGKEYTRHDNSVLEKFTDRNMISPHAMASMATLVGEGIIEGLPGNAIGPKATATRAQAAVLLYRAMNIDNVKKI